MINSGFLNFALVASLILNVTFLASAGYVSFRRNSAWISPVSGTMPQDRFLFDELALRPGQWKAMREKAIPFRAGIERCRGEIVDARKELIALMWADKPDKKAINAVISRISEAQREMQQGITDHMLAEKSLLNPEQRRKFLDLIEKRMTGGGPAVCPPVEHN